MRHTFPAFSLPLPMRALTQGAVLAVLLACACLWTPWPGGVPAQAAPALRAPVMESAPEEGPPGAAPEQAPAQVSGQAAPASDKAHGIKLFGTVEFRRPLSTLPGWLDVLDRNAASPIFNPARQFNRTTTWAMLRERAQGKSPLEVLKLVNTFWNTWPYREDMVNWGKPDYWAIPAQFLKKSGDCEDYAIAKYFTLRELGFPPEDMRIVVLRDTIRNLAHAVLVVYLDGEAYVLDNLSNVVQPHSRLRNYNPQYSVNENGRWTHIKGRPAGAARPGGKRQ
ncbi:transglutaminase-like cysteine peptidase [Desulfovibrio sp.]|uniref:transglutaminase-like cysteine peptidase n=1 Tax=Desulfovibrio sp. TaxID=885 RepID=UPI0026069DAA|nr:transglutaminase-like cysteine peptidase [Desulfovibrio sp.]